MGNDNELTSAKRAYKSAQQVGNRREEARWANVIADIYKERGEYCQALDWLRKDYKISSQFLSEKDCLPTCQSIGEMYLRLQEFENALYYQKEHLQLAKDVDDLVEQQRASTQLGRTYHEMFYKFEDHSALHKAKKYFKSAMSLAQALKENPPDFKSSFLTEYIDAYNNVGMLEMDLENLEEAEIILTQGLKICDEEEVSENDAGRSRLNHNLGSVYTQLRMWDKADVHIRKDIWICKSIGHRQGEAKGYINLGELLTKQQKFDRALASYKKALELARSLEDEYALARQAEENIEVVKEFVKLTKEMAVEEQKLKKLKRSWATAKGTAGERKSLKQLMKAVDLLIEKATTLSDWSKHREMAKIKKKIASELCDKEKLADSYLVIGESYQKLRKFQKSGKWYAKSLKIYDVIGNMEGQAIAKINMGDVLDSEGDWEGALKAFSEGHRIALQANKVSLQILALENMHYIHMMRFDNAEEVRKLKSQIENLQTLISIEQEPRNIEKDSCSETESEGNAILSEERFPVSGLSHNSEPLVDKPVSSIEHIDDDEEDFSPLSSRKKLQKLDTGDAKRVRRLSKRAEASPINTTNLSECLLATVSRKRSGVILSDDEEDAQIPLEDVATSNEFKSKTDHLGTAHDLQELVADGCKHDANSCSLLNYGESSCSYKSSHPEEGVHRTIGSLAVNKNNIIIMKVADVSVCVELDPCVLAGELDIEALKVQGACSYYLQLSSEKRSSGLLPIIEHLKFGEQILDTNYKMETNFFDIQSGGSLEASVNGWVQKRLIKMYVDCCQKLFEPPNMKLIMKLYNLEISEDEVIVSDCELQDMSVVPLLDALSEHKTISMLNLSHNVLGNATMERLKQALTLSGQPYGALVLDLHCNMFGPTTLFQICECPVLFNRLEVLNISGNRLTDACATYLSTILRSCKSLYSLNIERCSITSRTIQSIANALETGSVLSQLFIGHNNPILASSLSYLLGKLTKLERFSELGLDGLKLNKQALDAVCQFARSSCLSGLMLGATNIGSDGALKLTESLFHETQELAKLNLSYCGLKPNYFEKLKTIPAVLNIVELNLSGNCISSEGGHPLASILAHPECSVKVLLLNKGHLGLTGVVQIINSLAENESLEELYLAGNIAQEVKGRMKNDSSGVKISNASDMENKVQNPTNAHHGELNQLEVPDSYETDSRIDGSETQLADTCNSQGQRDILQPDDQHIKELMMAISNAKNLQLLDLSDNGFSTQVADALYIAWCSSSRASVASKHLTSQLLHLSTQDKICCGVKPCCQKN